MAEIDEIFNEFAQAFVGVIRVDREIAFPRELARERLDGTLSSLKLVDEYLDYVHRNRKKVSDDEWYVTVLWCGSYVGEVIRHTRKGEFSWIDYNDYTKEHPELRWMIPERTVATCGLLLGPRGGMSMPLNKVARFIEDGPENSVHFFCCRAKIHFVLAEV
jgi:hypothetical protein